MNDWGLYILLLVPTLLIGLAVQWWLRKTFERYSHIQLLSGMTGAEVARQILDRNGLEEVPVDRSDAGALSDNYDPRKKALHLSPPVYDPKTVAAAAVAAHESGHALQHQAGLRGPAPAQRDVPRGRDRLEHVDLAAHGRRAPERAEPDHDRDPHLRGRRPLPHRHAAGGVQRLQAGGPAAPRRSGS